MGQFEEAPPLWWEADGFERLYLSVAEIDEGLEKDVGRHKRLYRNGARLDHMGAQGRELRLTLQFWDANEREPAIVAQTNAGKPLRSYVLSKFIESFMVNATGDLMLPTRGLLRAGAVRYRRLEKSSDRDLTIIEAVWAEDAEDTASPEQYATASIPTVANKVQKLYEEKQATLGATSGSSLAQTLAEGPPIVTELQEYVSTGASTVLGYVELVRNEVLELVGPFRDEGTRSAPEEHRLVRASEIALDSTRRTKARTPAKPKIYDRPVSIMQLAVDTRRPVAELLADNPGLDPMAIPAGVAIRVRQ